MIPRDADVSGLCFPCPQPRWLLSLGSTVPPPLPLHGLDAGGKELRGSVVWGGDGDLLPTATVQGQIGSASDQPGLVQSVAVHGTGVERDIL